MSRTTCAFFIKKAYPDLKSKYVIEIIAEKLPHYNPKQLGLKVTYHDPCNVARGMGMADEPRDTKTNWCRSSRDGNQW